MFAAREDKCDEFVWTACCPFLSPADDIQSGLSLIAFNGKSIICSLTENAVAFCRHAANNKHWAGILFQNIESTTVPDIACLFHRGGLFSCQWIKLSQFVLIHCPVAFKWNNTSAACLKMHVVGT